MNSTENTIDAVEFDILSEIGNIGAGNATTALSTLVNGRVDMHVPKVEMLGFSELAEILGGADTLVVGVLLTLEGDIMGSMLFIMETTGAHHLVQKLMGGGDSGDYKDPMDVLPFSEMELSAMIEIGNIISGAYLTAISKMTNLSILPSVPGLAVDMAGAILSVPAIEFGKLGDKALLIESQFRDEEMDLSGYFILIPTFESYDHILKSLGM